MNKLALKAQESQRLAAHPTTNVWVSASAGSGKTKVLCDRILNLLLEGVSPQRILCLTFTNAAAAEMANRLQERVGEWAICDREKLAADLYALRENHVHEAHFTRARMLFDAVLESPGGLKIQTLHSFCQSLLKRFPLESGLPPHFDVIDEMEAGQLVKQAQAHLFEHPPHTEFEAALVSLLDTVTESAFTELTFDILNARAEWESFFRKYPDPALHQEAFQQHFNITEALPDFWEGLDENQFLATLKALGQGSVTEITRAEQLLQAFQNQDFEDYQSVFLTQKGELRARIYTQAFEKRFPTFATFLNHEARRVAHFIEQQKIYKTFQRSQALAIYAQGFLEAYQNAKKKRCVLDYDDLILETLTLLQTPGTAPWVLYKFDGGVDHILIDEAQDTSPSQWEVIKVLTEEFFSSGTSKTLFVVGDEKQSIYSFQGADPETFSQMKSFFKTRALERERPWEKVHLGISFRSTPEILQAVDAVFQNVNILTDEIQDRIQHEAFRSHLPGHVEVWPLCPRLEKTALIPWALLESQDDLLSPRARLAQKWAQTIRSWLNEQRWLPAQNRPIRPGDILILVRTRSRFVEDMIHFLKEENVPVAGHDRLRLQDHIITQDIAALFEFILLPENDLALATVLKSPFFGMDDEALFQLAWDRGELSLWERLAPGHVRDSLVEISREAKIRTPFSFLMWLFSTQNAQEKFTQRLGWECHDAFQEILSLALQFEKDHIPTLQGFLAWLTQGNLMVKRDLEEQNEVRVMTVHGSKGLQAPIVILPDTTQVPSDYPTFSFEESSGLPLWLSSQRETCIHTNALKSQLNAAQIQEYRRLLYVAMTRAQDELYIAGWENTQKLSDTSWYHMVTSGLAPIAEIRDESLIISSLTSPQVSNRKSPVFEDASAPTWLFEKVEVPPKISSLAPSGATQHLSTKAIQRGIRIHKLLETLPYTQTPPRDELVDQALHIIKSYPHLFGKNSRGEVPVLGQVNGLKISGQIDRLIIENHRIQIVDYKTSQNPPVDGKIPQNYIHQLAAYALLMREIYPTHHIECGILWTEIPRIDWVSEDLLSGAVISERRTSNAA